MRGMNLPKLPAPPAAIDECWKLCVQRLEQGVMPFPRASNLMTAYMAWPNDRKNRDRWMATNMALFLAERSLSPGKGSLESRAATSETPSKPQTSDQAAFELFGGLRVVADASLSHMMEKLESIQKRWPRVADVLQMVVDIHHENRAAIVDGASISKAIDVLMGHSSIPRRARLSQDWSDFRDVSHLIAAAAAVAFACREHTESPALLWPVLLAPEVVLGLGLAFQEFGLTIKPYRQRVSLLPAQTMWRIPKTQDFPSLPLPVRRLSDEDFRYLTTIRRARRKA
jgi:hypothetical protein